MLSFSMSIKPVNIYSLTYVCCLNNAFNYKKEDIPCKWTQVRQISEWGDIIAITVTTEQVGYILSYNLYSWLFPLSCTHFFLFKHKCGCNIFKSCLIDINWFVDFACNDPCKTSSKQCRLTKMPSILNLNLLCSLWWGRKK